MTLEHGGSGGPGQTAELTEQAGIDAIPDSFSDARDGRARVTTVPPDLLGLAWVVVAGVLVLVPALLHGVFLGSYDILANHGITSQPGVPVHNSDTTDQIREFIPWLSLAWQQVHAGHLPLWNSYSGLGAPLAFNWQSAPFGLPSLVSYIFPIRYAFDVSIVMTMVVAGSGGYLLARVVGLGVIAGAMIGTVFELSGPMIGWIGSPLASSISWIGWLCALSILIVRSAHRTRYVALLALATCLSVLGGSPEAFLLMFVAVVLFAIAALAVAARSGASIRGVASSGVRLMGAWILGAMLAAPVLVPGLQLVRGSIRNQSTFNYALPLHDVAYFVVQGFDGLPLGGSRFFGSFLSIETLSFVGPAALILGLVAVVHRWRRSEVLASIATLIVGLALVFSPGTVDLAKALPGVGTVLWQRALFPVGFALAVLAGSGIQALMRDSGRAAPYRTLLAGSCGVSALMGALIIWGRSGLRPGDAGVRLHGLMWALAASLAVAVVSGVVLLVEHRSSLSDREMETRSPGGRRPHSIASPRICAAIALLTVETASLLVAGAPWISSSPTGPVETKAVRELRQAVGGGTIGLGTGGCLFGYPDIGFLPNSNVLYGVRQMDVYDASTPSKLYSAWQHNTGTAGGVPDLYEFCPGINTVQTARLYGVSWILEEPQTPGPTGSVKAGIVGHEILYHVPNASPATLVVTQGSQPPSVNKRGSPVAVAHPNPSTVTVSTRTRRPTVLRLRITDVPGWHATIDGRPVNVVPFAGSMMQLPIPPGDHTVVVTYWPELFSVGLVLSVVAAIVLACLVLYAVWRRQAWASRPVGPSQA